MRRDRSRSSRRAAAPISVRASTSGTRFRSATAARSSTSRASGGATSSAFWRSPPPSANAMNAIRFASSSNSCSINHGAISSQSCTSSTSAANSAFSIGPRARRLSTWIAGRRDPRSAICTRSPTGIESAGRDLAGVELAEFCVGVFVHHPHRRLGEPDPFLRRIPRLPVQGAVDSEPEERARGSSTACWSDSGSLWARSPGSWPCGRRATNTSTACASSHS